MYRLLIVEEGQMCREILELTDWAGFGFEQVATASDFTEALDKAMSLQPHVALVGMTLADRRGYELAEHFRQMGLETICCVMTNYMDVSHLRRAMRAGCRDVLKRPPDALALKEFLDWAVTAKLHDSPSGGRQESELDPVLGIKASSLSRVTNKILLVVHDHFRQPLSLTVIAQEFRMSNKYIGRVFLKDTGMRFSEYLMAYRMLEARRLILSTGEKISVIAGMVGYSQQNNFYTHFHQYFGVSPSSLRNVQATKEAIV